MTQDTLWLPSRAALLVLSIFFHPYLTTLTYTALRIVQAGLFKQDWLSDLHGSEDCSSGLLSDLHGSEDCSSGLFSSEDCSSDLDCLSGIVQFKRPDCSKRFKRPSLVERPTRL